jgi:hypothetical protein
MPAGEWVRADRAKLDDPPDSGGACSAEGIEFHVGLCRRDGDQQEQAGASGEGPLKARRLCEFAGDDLDSVACDSRRPGWIAHDGADTFSHAK